MKTIIGYRVKSITGRTYVHVKWADEDRTVIQCTWTDTSKSPLRTKAEAYRLAAHQLERGFTVKLVKVTQEEMV